MLRGRGPLRIAQADGCADKQNSRDAASDCSLGHRHIGRKHTNPDDRDQQSICDIADNCGKGGVTLNPLYWPARHEETILTASIYKFHPDFAGKVNVWWGDPTKDWGLATLEGGDVMPIGKGNVLIGMSERTSRQAINQLAAALFEKGGAERVIIGAMPKLRAAMHIDTVFTFAECDCVLIYPDIVNKIECFSYRPGAKKGAVELHKEKGGLVETIRGALGLKTMRRLRRPRAPAPTLAWTPTKPARTRCLGRSISPRPSPTTISIRRRLAPSNRP